MIKKIDILDPEKSFSGSIPTSSLKMFLCADVLNGNFNSWVIERSICLDELKVTDKPIRKTAPRIRQIIGPSVSYLQSIIKMTHKFYLNIRQTVGGVLVDLFKPFDCFPYGLFG